jgi:hypothetical protein
MSQAAVEQVVGKLVLDRAFRKLMTSNMSQALAGYDLTEGEREGFTHVDLDDFHQSVTGLDERVSKGFVDN